MQDSDDTILAVLWQRVLDEPDSKEAHDKLVQHALASSRLHDVAKRYRERRDELDQGDDARAVFDERLAAIAALAIADLEARKPERRERHPLVTGIMVVLGLFFLASIVSLIRALLL